MSNECLDVDVPGFKVSQLVTQKPALRGMWYLTFVVCSFISLRMIIERVTYYFTYPTMLTFAPSEMESFPSITFCPSEQNFMVDPFYSAISKCKSSMKWQDCKQPELWTSHLSVNGMAYTLNLEKAYNSSISFTTFHTEIAIEFNQYYGEYSMWKVLLHHHEDDIIYGCATSAIDIEPNTEFRLTFTRTKTIYENVPTRPCQSTNEHRKCSINCLESFFTRIRDLNCRLDFMITVKDLPLCDEPSAYSLEWTISEILKTKNIDDKCACVKACENSRFELNIDTDENEIKTYISIARGRDQTEIRREKISYTGYSLMCEVGGIIGFNLGACLVTFIQVIQHFSTRLYAHVTAPKGKPYLRKHMAHSKECPCCNQPLPTSVQ